MQTEIRGKRRCRLWQCGLITIWSLASVLAAAQVRSGELADTSQAERQTTVERVGDEASSPADTGPAAVAACAEHNVEWSPQGKWSGRYRLAGDDITVEYTLDANAKMDMQLDLSPRSRYLYHVTTVQADELSMAFSKDKDTHCVLSRGAIDDDFEGNCLGPNGDIVVSFISMRRLHVDQPKCDD
jgi:hypothetical protein